MYYKTTCLSPVGLLTLACDGDNLIGLWLEGQKYHGDALFPNMTEKSDLPIFDATRAWIDRYFAGERPAISELTLSPIGSAFRQSVWDVLCEIPYGEVTTYGAIAKKLACASARAVGGAVGQNPISIIIPCHRVVGAGGALTGYAGGLETKVKLLELEGVLGG
ncbi:MAG: methylated-DNA--[protein]-cysteine S-methyltransferase [Clostridiales bacterium]|nr:methylated-DNA--[protein]-cysteine S-methyltransferase [Clostridiales bacterium]